MHRSALVGVGMAALLLALLGGVMVRGAVEPMSLDVRLWEASDSPRLWRLLGLVLPDPPERWLERITGLSRPEVTGAVAVVLAALAFGRRQHRLAAWYVLTPIVSFVLAWAAKPIIARRLDGDYAYPSGHATAGAVLVGLLVITAWRRFGGIGAVAAAGFFGAVWAGAMIQFSHDRYHYPTDLLSGGLLGAGMVCLLAGWLLAGPGVSEHPIEARSEAGDHDIATFKPRSIPTP